MNALDSAAKFLRCIGPIPDGPCALWFFRCWMTSITSSFEITLNCYWNIVPSGICGSCVGIGVGCFSLKSCWSSSSVQGL